jgi:hypothetical protein
MVDVINTETHTSIKYVCYVIHRIDIQNSHINTTLDIYFTFIISTMTSKGA